MRLVGHERHRGVNEIADEGKNHRHLVADAVNEQAENNDAHAERPDARALEFADDDIVQAEIGLELSAAQNHAADEGVAGGDEGDEAAPEKNFVVPVVHGFWNCRNAPDRRAGVNGKISSAAGTALNLFHHSSFFFIIPPDAAAEPTTAPLAGQLARGLSALFWGLPATLLISAETARADWLKPLGLLPVLAINALLLYGLWQMSAFSKTGASVAARAGPHAAAGAGNPACARSFTGTTRMPGETFFSAAVMVLELSAVLFLFNLNLVLKRLAAMLPDETLRQETRQFTTLNRWLLVTLLFFADRPPFGSRNAAPVVAGRQVARLDQPVQRTCCSFFSSCCRWP